jgi:hypothetical protein
MSTRRREASPSQRVPVPADFPPIGIPPSKPRPSSLARNMDPEEALERAAVLLNGHEALKFVNAAAAAIKVKSPKPEKLIGDKDMDEEFKQFLFKNYYSVQSTLRKSISIRRSFAEQDVKSGDVKPSFPGLEGIETWRFDMISFAQTVDNKPIRPVVQYLFKLHNFYEKFDLNPVVVENFLVAVEMSYNDVPYHNSSHAADVAHATHFFLSQPSIRNCYSDEELFTAIVAAVCHDVAHPGNNNQFEIATSSELAITYNDKSVLENHHLATTFRILRSAQHNIFSGFSRDKYKQIRNQIVDMVLATDMQDHARGLVQLQSAIAQKKELGTCFTSADKTLIFNNAIHCADLSNPCRPLEVSLRWTARVYEEFWRQGDMERKLDLPISPLCDRQKPNFENSNIGFIGFVIRPLYSTWVQVVPEAHVCIEEMEKNLQYWQDQAKSNSS